MSFTACEGKTNLTDAEIAAVIRSSAGSAGVTDRIETMVLLADCKAGKGHDGPCASWVAISYDASGNPSTAWLRWSGKDRVIDWLAHCVMGNCLLFRGHVGDCRPSRGLNGTRPALNRKRAWELGVALIAFAEGEPES